MAGITSGLMTRWLVKVRSPRGWLLRRVSIVAPDEETARERVQQMYRTSDVGTIYPSAEPETTSDPAPR